MKPTLLLVLAVASAGQASCATTQDLLKGDRPIRADKIATVLKGVRAALAGKALRLVRPEDQSGNSLAEIVIGPHGVPQFMRRHLSYDGGMVSGVVGVGGTVDTPPVITHFHVEADLINEFTGGPPRGCDGTPRTSEFIVEYRNEGHGWTTTVKATRDLGYTAGAFDILTGALASEIGQRGFVGGRIARALVAHWTAPRDDRAQPTVVIGDPFPNVRGKPPRRTETTQKLWIDVESLLPLQWETPVDAVAFRYDPTIAITRPDGIEPPACVP